MLVVSLCRAQDEVWTSAARWHVMPTAWTAITGSRRHGTVHDRVMMLDVVCWRWGVRRGGMGRWAVRGRGWQSGGGGGPAYGAASQWRWDWLRRNGPRETCCRRREDRCRCGLRLKGCWKLCYVFQLMFLHQQGWKWLDVRCAWEKQKIMQNFARSMICDPQITQRPLYKMNIMKSLGGLRH